MLLADRLAARRLALPRIAITPFRVIVVGAFAGYLLVAAILVLGFHIIVGDAWSRVGNAYYIVASRDPHLAAIGFVWGPFPSLLELPLLPFARLWPDLASVGFAGSIVSAGCMALAVWQVWGAAGDWGVGQGARVVLTAVFALHPMIVDYGANGMSEAFFLLTLIVAARYLARWLRDGEHLGLVVAGVALAFGYLARYEAIPAAVGAALLVAVTTARRTSGPPRARLIAGAADAVVLVVPPLTAFIGFAFASLLIVGDPFQQFTSVYGLSSQIAVAGADFQARTGQGTAAAYPYIAGQVVGLSPLVLILVPIALVAGGRRPNAAAWAVLATLGAVVAWAVVGFLTGRTLGWLRYSIAVVPLDCLLVAALVGTRTGRLPAFVPAWTPRGRLASMAEALRLEVARIRWPGPPLTRVRPLVRPVASVGFIGILVVTIPIGALTMLDERFNPSGGEGFLLRPIVHDGPYLETDSPLAQYLAGRDVATYLDSLGLHDGQVLLDSSSGFPIILQSRDPRQFVITSDRDFQAAVQAPAAFGIRYLVVPDDVGYAKLDALNRAYPGLYETGAGIASLVRTFSENGAAWRIYDVGTQVAG